MLDAAAVFAAVSPAQAIERTRLAFERHAHGEWEMPAKTYLEAPPNGDFRAMPARGEGLALLKWVTSFPGNSERGLPVVTGALLLSSADTGELLAIMDCASITSLRTGAGAALSAQVLAAEAARSVGIIGCGVNGAWAARCLAAAGLRPRRLRRSARRGGRRARRRAGLDRGRALRGRDAGHRGHHHARRRAGDHGLRSAPRPAPGRARGRCRRQGGGGARGRRAAAVSSATSATRPLEGASSPTRSARGSSRLTGVTQLGDVLIGRAAGRSSSEEITLFDSTGLAIQDLAIALSVYEAWRRGEVPAQDVTL